MFTLFAFLLYTEKRSTTSTSDDSSNESSIEFWSSDSSSASVESSKMRPSWGSRKAPESVYSAKLKGGLSTASVTNSGPLEASPVVTKGLSEEQKELIDFARVERKKNFVHYEKVNGKETNILRGLELHSRVFNADEQKKIVDCVYDLQRMGQKGQLRGTTLVIFTVCHFRYMLQVTSCASSVITTFLVYIYSRGNS